MSHSEAIGVMIILLICSPKSMLLFISTFCKINFCSINLNMELGQQATLLMAGREIRKYMLRALWILQNNVIIGKNLWVRNLFSFYNFQCPSERINSELTINIILGRNHLTQYLCCSTWHAYVHMIPPELKHTFLKNGRKQCMQPSWKHLLVKLTSSNQHLYSKNEV